MPETPEGWSTPKFLLVSLLITFAVMFFGNAICNEVLELRVRSGVFAGIAGALVGLCTLRWRVLRGILKGRKDAK